MTDNAYATNFKHLADMKDSIDKELGLTEWVQIDQQRIDTFAEVTEDLQWIHINPEQAKLQSPYGKTIAHGFLVLSLASKFAYETYSIDDVVMGVNYGLDRVRFPNATLVDSWVRGRISLMTFTEIPGGARFKLGVVFEIKGQEKPACVAEFIGQAYTG